jgi:hypothetical protein
MSIHAWSKTDAGLFHHFHQFWIVNLCTGLNAGVLPRDCFALAEQTTAGPIPDVLPLHQASDRPERPSRGEPPVGVALAQAAPRTTYPPLAEPDLYALKADRIAIRHRLGGVVAVIEIVSPGNKSSKAALRSFVDKAVAFLRQGVHLLVIDLFPPTPRDPQGLHKAIWDEILEEPFTLPPDRPLTLASYSAGDVKIACVEPVAVGDPLPDMPLFIEPERYVSAPLQATYALAWNDCPAPFREAVIADAETH